MSAILQGPSVGFADVTRIYGDATAVDSVTLDIAGGSFVALVGESGSGKSTMLKMINRLQEPDTGTVSLNGRPVGEGEAYELRRRIGYVFQSVGLFPHLSVGENVGIGLRLLGQTSAPERIAEMLRLVGLDPAMASRRPDSLSGGQGQRVGIARALAPEARLLLMDEPFGALDPLTRAALGNRVRHLHDQLSLTTIIVTHDMAEALLLADRILIMRRGRIVADASPRALLNGAGGLEAEALIAVPREQARRLAGLVDG
ncbi:ATP-binding cassette domain-containing protein [Sphingomonas sp. SRS2]|uniref:ATP-binding cassette domain-containing protein n=1 Tax=Sphingomonas sp. SRS2 TaxID=133190 RepID=UPI0006184349|nr:ATP-binding cassette domain-containing protein [Sphingomonas sp. SRS2]KKC27248.1 ABC transporter ATP-binding protein [Sphingomonas sp. SRS2]